MQFFLHLWTNLEYFQLLNEWYLLSKWKEDKSIAQFFSENFPWELADTLSPQYEVNFETLRELKRKFGQEVFQKIDGVYYGSDNCEYLAPYKKDTEAAVEQFKIFNQNFPPHKIRTFVFVTPYVGNTMMKYLEESLEYLNTLTIKNPIEVVVNDFWVLRLLTTKYTNLKPIFWRVIHKLLKTPLIDSMGYDVHPSGEDLKNKPIQEKERLQAEIIKWQLRFYNSAEVSLEHFRDFLKKYCIERVTLDFMEKREALYDNTRFWDIGIDLYYPWALIFTGRLCDTSAVENPSRGYYATDDICPRTCNRFDVFFKVQTSYYHMLQRGNAWYRSEVNLDYLPELFVKNENNRIIYAPFVTV
jgi:hypothetical protein